MRKRRCKKCSAQGRYLRKLQGEIKRLKQDIEVLLIRVGDKGGDVQQA